jgi:leader peptidase (prepilin peptidase)/N-methyltransferase
MDDMLNLVSMLFGAMIGSFLNVCICRLPKGESIVTPGSHCPQCGKPIRWYDNLPLVSFLLLRGKCRHCHRSISVQYPLVEGITALLSLLLFVRFGPSVHYIVYFAFTSALVVITVIDLHHQIIPDVISLPGIAAGLLASGLLPEASVVNALLGVLLGGGSLFLVATLYEWLFKREGMGGGDVKLLAMIGAFLGWKAVILTILFSSLIGSIVGIAVILWKGRDFKYAIPFGPFLSLGAVIALFYGERLIFWYLTLNR